MVRPFLQAGIAAAVLLAAAPAHLEAQRPPRTARAQVHCPTNGRAAFVTPASLRITVGDTVEWNVAGPVPSDSIIITPKDTAQVWPFAGTPSRGRGAGVRANGARIRGTYRYNVTLLCRTGGQGLQRVVIDPDIIID